MTKGISAVPVLDGRLVRRVSAYLLEASINRPNVSLKMRTKRFNVRR